MLLLAAVFVAIYCVVALRSLFSSLLPLLLAGGFLVLLLIITWWLVRRIRYFHADELFTHRDVAFAILAGVILSFAQGAFFYQISTYFQKVQAMPSALAGIAVAPYIAGLLIASLLITRLILRFGVRRMIAGGLILMSIGLVALSFVQVTTPYWMLVFPITLTGFGFGIAVPARTQVVLAAPPVELIGSAAAVNAASSQSGYALGIVVSSALVTRLADAVFIHALDSTGVVEMERRQLETAMVSPAQRLMSGDYPLLPPFVVDLVHTGYDKAFTTGLGQMFLVLAAITVLTAAVSYFGIRDEKKPPTTALTTAGRTGKPV
jgi:MFS family permease